MADIGERVSYEEAVALVDILILEPESWLHARYYDWKHPSTRAAIVLSDIYDLTVAVNTGKKSQKPKPYPRPWTVINPESTRVGRGNKRTNEETKAILARVAGRNQGVQP